MLCVWTRGLEGCYRLCCYRLCCGRDHLWGARHVAVRKALRQCVVTHLSTVGGYVVSYMTLTSRFTEFQRLRPHEQGRRELASDVTKRAAAAGWHPLLCEQGFFWARTGPGGTVQKQWVLPRLG